MKKLKLFLIVILSLSLLFISVSVTASNRAADVAERTEKSVLPTEQEPDIQIVTIDELFEDNAFIAENNRTLVEHFGEEYLENYAKARANYAIVMEEIERFRENRRHAMEVSLERALARECEEALARMHRRNRTSDMLAGYPYPRRLGGIYFNEDGHLVVQSTCLSSRWDLGLADRWSEVADDGVHYVDTLEICTVRNIDMRIAEDAGIIIEYVEFSYNYLNEVRAVIDRFLRANQDCDDVFLHISGIGTDVKNNRVNVFLRNLSEESISWFRNNITDSAAIVFEYCLGLEPTISYSERHRGNNSQYTPVEISPFNTVTFNPGRGVNIGTPGNFGSSLFSLGYRARIGSVNGIVTTGHVVDRTGATVGAASTTIGTINRQRLSGNVDAAWIRITNPNVNFTNRLEAIDRNLSTRIVETFRVGEPMSKRGFASGTTHGNVVDINYTSHFPPQWGNVSIGRQVRTNVVATNGDSGGVVWGSYFIGPHIPPDNRLATAGVVSANSPRGGMVFTRAERIRAAWDVVRY